MSNVKGHFTEGSGRMLVVLSSATSAERLKKLLQRYRIGSEVVQTPKSISVGGCGYSLKISKEHEDVVINKAKELHIAVKGVYNEEGKINERAYRKKG